MRTLLWNKSSHPLKDKGKLWKEVVVLRVHRANHRLEGARGQTDVQQQQVRA